MYGSPKAVPDEAVRVAKAARDEADAQRMAQNRVKSELMAACERGDTDEAVRLVSCCGADVTASTGPLSLTPLHAAARKGHADTVRVLVSRLGADVNAKAYDWMTPLHYAVSSSAEGATEAARVLVEELGAAVDMRDDSGWTPLYTAARREQFETVLLLARLGADVNSTVALDVSDTDDSDSDDAERQRCAPTALHFAAVRGRVDVIRSMVKDFNANVNAIDAEGRTPLHCAAQFGHSEAAIALVIEFGADVEAKARDGRTPLHMAVLTNHNETVRTLIDTLGASLLAPIANGLSPLHLAAKRVKTVRALLARGADVSPPLHFAARYGSAEVVEALLEHGADPEATDGDEDEPHTAAFLAAMNMDEGVCKVLIGALAGGLAYDD